MELDAAQNADMAQDKEATSCTIQQPPGSDTFHSSSKRPRTSPTHQPHVPDNVTLPWLPQQEHRNRRGLRSGQKVGKQELEKGKSGFKQVSAEMLRQKRRSKEGKLVVKQSSLNGELKRQRD